MKFVDLKLNFKIIFGNVLKKLMTQHLKFTKKLIKNDKCITAVI